MFKAGADAVFQGRVECNDAKFLLGVAVASANSACQSVANVFGQQDGVFGPRRIVTERFEDRPELADGDLFAEQHLQDLLDFGQRHLLWNELIDNGW